MDTHWFPAPAGKELKAVTSAGIVEYSLAANFTPEGLHLSGAFSVFFPGKLDAHIFDP
jgi:hypothetical protein